MGLTFDNLDSESNQVNEQDWILAKTGKLKGFWLHQGLEESLEAEKTTESRGFWLLQGVGESSEAEKQPT